MICPSCNQSASSLLRSAFSFQGVSIFKSAQGYFKCQQCGGLLRISGYGKGFWYFYVPTIIVLVLFALLYRDIMQVFGDNVGIIWVALLLVIFTTFALALWKNAQIKKVDTDSTSTTHSST